MTNSIPIIAKTLPATVELKKGEKYAWCRCGLSMTQPFCDGAHRGTELTPLKFIAENTARVTLCQCKASANPPLCDGSHTKLGTCEIGSPVPALLLEQ
ncbi:MAG: glutamate synthase [Acidiferrobacteraceae bacterium]|nr:glutamate synthase [Acidiferrobacteraceae bacterium]